MLAPRPCWHWRLRGCPVVGAEQCFSTGYFKTPWLLAWLLEEDGGDGQGPRQQLTQLLFNRNHLPDGLLALV